MLASILCVVRVLDFSNFNGYTVVSPCFNLQFPNDMQYWYFLYTYFGIHIHIFFGVQTFCPILNRMFIFLLGVKGSLYIVDITLLSDTDFLVIFSQYLACLFILLTMSFVEQNF